MPEGDPLRIGAAGRRPLGSADARAVREALEDRLYEFNRSAVGRDDGREFALAERDADGALVAGLAGWVWAGACEIRALWVDEPLRGRGVGRRLLEAAEAHAREHGCAVVLVASYSFQAPGFYERAGYRLAWRLEDFPPGHAHHYLVKRLPSGTL